MPDPGDGPDALASPQDPECRPIASSIPSGETLAPSLPDISPFETQCLRRLWAREHATIREIHGDLPDPPSYSTVRKIIERLEEKGAVERVRRSGRAWVYRATVPATAMIRKQIRRVLETLFDGVGGPLVAHLAEMDALTLEDLREVEERLAAREEREEKSP
jgi:predicted transcriptional regulator